MDSVNADRVLLCRVSPFGNLRLNAYLQLPVAYRSLSRPSSALSAKAFPLRPLQLNLCCYLLQELGYISVYFSYFCSLVFRLFPTIFRKTIYL